MKALGGRGMYDASRFFECVMRVGPKLGEAGGEYVADSSTGFSETTSKVVGSVLYVIGVISAENVKVMDG